MTPIKRALALCAISTSLFTVNTQAGIGDIDIFYRAVFDIPGVTTDCGGGQCFAGFGPPEQSGTTVSGSSVTLGPEYTFYAAGDAFWDNNGSGNKLVVASSFGEQVGVPVGTGTITVEACVNSYTLGSDYAVQGFVKLLDPNAGYSDILGTRLPFSRTGSLTISADLSAYEGDTVLIAQVGFEVSGPNGNPANPDGTVDITMGSSCGGGGGSALPPAGDPNAIPTLPIWGIFGLSALIGLMGWSRRKPRV